MPERGMESLRMMGWGLVVVESSSAAVAAAVVVVAAPPGGGEGRILGFSSKNIEYRHLFYQGVFFLENSEPPEARSRLWQGSKMGDRFFGRILNRRRLAQDFGKVLKWGIAFWGEF